MLTAYVPSAAGLKKFDGLQPDALPGEAIWIDMKTPSPGEDKAVEKLVGIEILDATSVLGVVNTPAVTLEGLEQVNGPLVVQEKPAKKYKA